MNIKDELLELYCRKISDFQYIQDNCKDDNISGPLLMSPSENYAKQIFPFFAIGQETNGWNVFSDVISKEELKKLIYIYEDFNVGKHHHSAFWNTIREIETALGNESCSCAWTNISKYDQNNVRPDADHEKLFSIVDNLLIDELKIIKPKICIFFISYQFDYRLKNIFKSLEFIKTDEFDMNTLCQLKHPDLPVLTFRTYHPHYLLRKKIKDSIINFISKQIK
jgi:hypothetical protein